MFWEKLIIHPFLFAMFPILFMYTNNINETSFSELIILLCISIVSALILYLLTFLITFDKYKSSLITFTIIFLFYTFGHVYMATQNIVKSYWILLIIWGVGFIFIAIFVIKTNSSLRKINGGLNVFVVCLIFISFIRIGIYQIADLSNDAVYNKIKIVGSSDSDSESEIKKENLPDIYYIIPDGYARADILKSEYNFDNNSFTSFLTDKGFYIAEGSNSNYSLTFLSLASSLNMIYIDNIAKDIGSDSTDRQVPYEMIQDNTVMRKLKNFGYKTIVFKSGWAGTNYNKFADKNINDGRYTEFSLMLIKTTILNPFMQEIGIARGGRSRILNNFSKLAKIAKQDDSTFTFIHMICPHPPYLFGKNGESVSSKKMDFSGNSWADKESYLNQLIFLNSKIMNLINEILLNSKRQPIIIIQADHGPASSLNNEKDWESPDTTMVKERMGILNAYFWPGDGKEKLYQTITPVNSFRLMFNTYFGENYKLLKDDSFFSSYQKPYYLREMSSCND